MKRARFFTVLLMAVLISCSTEFSRTQIGESAIIYFNPVQNGAGTKSYVMDDSLITDSNVFVYDDDGVLVYSSFSEGVVREARMLLFSDRRYQVHYVANCGNLTDDNNFSTASGADSFQYEPAFPVNTAGAVPMSFKSEPVDLARDREMDIPLERAIARVNISLNTDSLSDNSTFIVKSLHIRNVPNSTKLFSESRITSARECLTEGYSAEADDIENLNTGRTISFPIFENCQGDLLPGNKIQSGKQFDAGNPLRDVCTFIELDAEISTQARHGTCTYRFYPGSDLFTNFDIKRNNDYRIVISPTEEGLSEESWRIDVTSMEDYITSIKLDAAKKELFTKGSPSSTVITATVFPATAPANAFELSSSDESVISLNGTKISATGSGTAYIKARATDGSGICDSIMISVVEPEITSLEFGFDKFHKDISTTAILRATYSNGFSENVSKLAEWEYDDSMLSKKGTNFTAIGSGNTTITANYSYKGETHSVSKEFTSYDISKMYLSSSDGENYISLINNLSAYNKRDLLYSVYVEWEDGLSSIIYDYNFSNVGSGLSANGSIISSNASSGDYTFNIDWKTNSITVNVHIWTVFLEIWSSDSYRRGGSDYLLAVYNDQDGKYWNAIEDVPGGWNWSVSNDLATLEQDWWGARIHINPDKTGTFVLTITHDGNSVSKTITVK